MNICACHPMKRGLRPLHTSECERVTSQPPPTSSKMGGHSEQSLSHKERDDNYFAVVAELVPRWRVILCKNGIQFILQRHFAETLHGGAWRSSSFHVSRDSLIQASVALGLASDPKMEQLLAGLPATARECVIQRAQK